MQTDGTTRTRCVYSLLWFAWTHSSRNWDFCWCSGRGAYNKQWWRWSTWQPLINIKKKILDIRGIRNRTCVSFSAAPVACDRARRSLPARSHRCNAPRSCLVSCNSGTCALSCADILQPLSLLIWPTINRTSLLMPVTRRLKTLWLRDDW